MKIPHSPILCILLVLLPLNVGFAECAIDGRLTTNLVAYDTKVTKELAKLTDWITNNCWGGVVKSANKTVEIIDKALVQIPLHWDIITDFEYNITMALKWESRSAVQRNGQIFQKVHKKISKTIDSLSSTCNLTESKESELEGLIQTNYLLESVYKTVAVGWVAEWRDQLTKEYTQHAFDEIRDEYNPIATASCKNEFDFEQKINNLMESFSKWTFWVENAYEDWYEAIALFSGRSRNWLYKDVARKLLVKELNRQWLSKNNQSIIVSNFDCAKAREGWDGTLEDKAKAIAECREIQVTWLSEIAKELMDDPLKTSKNTEIYITQISRNRDLLSNMTAVADIYAKYSSQSSTQTPVNESMLSSLVELHIGLLSINKILEVRIPVMQKNCMKAIPEIIWWCRKEG
jgi:hypothetical protein